MAKDKLSELTEIMDSMRAREGGEAAAKRKADGRMTARERLSALFDGGAFTELDAFAETRATDFGMQGKKVRGDGVVTGYGKVGGRTVCASSQDFTVIGGSLGETHARKIAKVMDLAIKVGAPFVAINDSGGARVQEGVDSLSGYGEIFMRNTKASGVIPQISVIMGPCAGGAVYSPAITDFVFMVDGGSHMFITGPEVIRTVTGEAITPSDLGGAKVHGEVSGVAHFVSTDEADCVARVRELLSYLPGNNMSDPPGRADGAACGRVDGAADHAALDSVIPDDPGKPYDMKSIIKAVVDGGEFLESQEGFARNVIVGFARIGGMAVGMVANQPAVLSGCLDCDSADKASRFVRFCDAFGLPLVTFTDTPGYLPGVGQEHAGVIRHGAKLLYAFAEATVPKVNVITRKAIGGAYIAMNSKHLGADVVLAWPTVEIAVMGAEGAANIVFKKEIDASDDPAKARGEKVAEYRERFASPYIAAARGYVDAVIAPSGTREALVGALEALAPKREDRPPKRHGNIPL
ncbi:MAG: methylmalonyl-CoA carboxyltransferase [Oscillospiraceae bacterium]|nr:methylmalonyl-CoA carboxyltransferase [Oscillospiraceae bacterium]